jgi:dCTP deaminase
MTVIKKNRIIELLQSKDRNNRLVITPLLDHTKTIGASSVDLRLGTEFILLRRRSLQVLDIRDQDGINQGIYSYQERIRINYGSQFVIHPGQLVLGSILEYISLPSSLLAYVVGKSTWGRTGLIIATATKVDPGFKGSITLEIANLGEVPIVLYPGIPIAQLVLHSAEGQELYEGKYKNPTGPQFPALISDDPNWTKWFKPFISS